MSFVVRCSLVYSLLNVFNNQQTLCFKISHLLWHIQVSSKHKESVTEAKVLTLIYTHIHLLSEPPCSTTCLRLSCLLTDKFTLVIDNLWVLSELCITNRFICLYVYRIYVMCADEFVHTSGAMTDWVRDIQDPRWCVSFRFIIGICKSGTHGSTRKI